MIKSSAARRAALTGLAAVATVGLVLGTAAPAMAAGRTLPTGDQMFIVDCDQPIIIELYGVDAATADSTLIGDGTNPVVNDGCAYQPAYDVTTGISYFIEDRDIDGDSSTLWRVDTVTGESVQVGEFHTPELMEPQMYAMAIGIDGKAYAIDDNDELYSLNLANAEVTFVQALADGPIHGFAVDPRSGQFYVTETDDLYRLDVSTGVLTPVLELDFLGTSIRSLQVDTAGVFWYINDFGEGAELWSSTAAEGSELLSGVFSAGDPDIYSQALLIIPVPAPALAATGSELAPTALIAGLGILTLGGALLLLRRRAAKA
jgi:LPXTG-motif cell wall-anchored protein